VISYPLEGVKVVDLTQYVAGPYCTQVLADLGASVLKVERPGGDVYRRQGPVFVEGESVSFLALNRGKQSVVLDLADEADRKRLFEFLEDADVLVENMRPGALARFGLDYPSLADRFPRLVYCSISAFGSDGPLAGSGGYDLTVQALSGLMAMTGQPGGPPAKIPIAAIDFGGALYGALGILAALRQRDATGRGQHVESSLLGCALAWLSMHIVTYLYTGDEPKPLGTRSPFFAPYEAYRTKDGYLVVVGTGGTDSWGDLCRELGLERLLDDPRFATNSDRVREAEALQAELESVFTTDDTDRWVERLTAAGVPSAPVQQLGEVLESEQVAALGLLDELAHPRAGRIPIVRLPLSMSDAKVTADQAPPLLGGDSGEERTGASREVGRKLDGQS